MAMILDVLKPFTLRLSILKGRIGDRYSVVFEKLWHDFSTSSSPRDQGGYSRTQPKSSAWWGFNKAFELMHGGNISCPHHRQKGDMCEYYKYTRCPDKPCKINIVVDMLPQQGIENKDSLL